MKCKGRIKEIVLDYVTQRPQIRLEVEAKPEDIEKLSDMDLSVELKQYRNHRSLDANAYYWALCTQIADLLHQSVNYTHNFLLRRYGQIEQFDGQSVFLVIPDTDEATKTADEAETYHIKPTSEVKQGKDGKMYRTYLLLRGSHDYDSKEMSRLIDGTISEAKELGIDTITDTEKKRMMAFYATKHDKTGTF